MTSNATHTIATDAQPNIPSGWKIEGHRSMGQVTLELRDGTLFANGREVTLFLSERQNTAYIRGHELRKELANRPTLNATILDHLLANPELIPDSWKGRYVFYWGTIYRGSGGGLFVGFLCWSGSRWGWRYVWLDCSWYSGEPTALLAS